ncbi:MAG TPA: hypothetical protein VG937_32555 [Polyangiaceae bacterium]|nr:hypothetical protein [Polyangiaceae bacterium]
MSASEGERRARRAVSRADRRLRARAALGRVASWLPLPLAYGVVALSVLKLAGWGPSARRVLVLVGALLTLTTVGVILRALLRRPPRFAAALALDHHHGLGDRVTTALSLLEVPADQRGGFVTAAIDDGLGVADKLDPRRAVPVPIPRELGVSVLLMGALLSVLWFEVRSERVLPPPPSFEPLVMAGDDLELFADLAHRLAERAEDPESLAAIRRFNALVEDIAARRLERREAFEKMSDLESELAKSAEIDREARELGLEGLARELARSGLAKTAAQALDEKRLADAEQALRELSDRLKRKERAPSRAELDRLRSAAARASRVNGERLAAIEQRRRELTDERKSLLDPKNQGKPAGDPGKVEENRRKLERLERDRDRAERAARQLSDLDRELAKAAEDLAKQQTQAGAEDIRRSADELSKVQKREMGEKEKRELLERLREMKELLRQQGQGGQERMRQMARFGQRARGGKGGKGQGDSQSGSSKGQKSGPGGLGRTELVEVPRIVRTPGQSPGSSSGEGKPGGDKGTPGTDPGSGSGPQAGTGHDDRLSGDATQAQGQTHDVSAAGIDTGQGSASAEVIHGAAERGFVGKQYRDVYREYETVAEQSLEHDQIPPGYRFYVRRYFQLIRPRE